VNRVAIIDYGVGNLRSVEKAFAATGCEAIISDDESVLRTAQKLVLPGVGAFGACMKALKGRGFDRLVCERARAGTPLLGVCVGMQLLFDESDEFGSTPGLGLLRGSVRRFGNDLVVPQVGWNRIHQKRSCALFDEIEDGAFCYFVHSFYCQPRDESVIAGETDYGGRYASVIARGNICGVQFHPEKSQDVGLTMLRNFATDEHGFHSRI
jgi:imidazole glycerol-phosphate synthase subunit HisH